MAVSTANQTASSSGLSPPSTPFKMTSRSATAVRTGLQLGGVTHCGKNSKEKKHRREWVCWANDAAFYRKPFCFKVRVFFPLPYLFVYQYFQYEPTAGLGYGLEVLHLSSVTCDWYWQASLIYNTRSWTWLLATNSNRAKMEIWNKRILEFFFQIMLGMGVSCYTA